jgi:hypothetical protein
MRFQMPAPGLPRHRSQTAQQVQVQEQEHQTYHQIQRWRVLAPRRTLRTFPVQGLEHLQGSTAAVGSSTAHQNPRQIQN